MSNWNPQIREFLKREHKLAGGRGWVWGCGGGENQGLQKSPDIGGARSGFLPWQQRIQGFESRD